MRELNFNEQSIIRNICSVNSLKETLVMKWLYNYVNTFVIEWDNDYTYLKICGRYKELLEHDFDKLLEFIFLMEYLEKNGYIFIYETGNNENKIYSRKSFKFNNNTLEIINESGGVDIAECNYFTRHTNLGEKVSKYANSFFYISEGLRELVKNKFKTEEQIQFETQLKDSEKKHNEAMGKAQKSLWLSWVAFIVALLPALFDLSNVFCPDMKIKELNESLKSIHSDIIKLSNDTVKTISSTHILPIEQEEEKVKTKKE